MNLNQRQEKFCMEYAKTGNATQSYKKVYAVKDDNSAQAAASRLLANEKIQARLRELSAEVKADEIAEITEIQSKLTAVMRGEEMTTAVTKDGEIVTLPVTMKDKLKAMELLLKSKGGFISKQELSISETLPVVIRDNI